MFMSAGADEMEGGCLGGQLEYESKFERVVYHMTGI